MKRLIYTVITSSIIALSAVNVAWSSEAAVSLGTPHIDQTDQASLQRGAKAYMSYCSGCHSLRFMRYNRLARDIGITTNDGVVSDSLLKENLIFTGAKVADPITNAMPVKESKKWFGTAPPDLSLEARARGTEWLYNYLMGFYRDPARPWGVNNVAFKDVGMPNVLAHLQGVQEPVYRVQREEEKEVKSVVGVKIVHAGEMKADQFEELVNDLVNFLSYVGNPVQEESKRIGMYALLFFAVLFVFSWALKREYWKDIH